MIEFEIRQLPPMLNVFLRKHFRKRKEISDYWNHMIWALTAKQRPSNPWDRYKLTLIRYSSSEPDYDGLVGSFKLPVDALRYAKIISDDKLSNSGIWNVQWIKAGQSGGKIWIRIEEDTKNIPIIS